MTDDEQERPDLIFHWSVQERRGWKLTLAVLTVTLFLGGFLLLFQVVYPAARHHRLVPQRVMLLDLSSPAARQLVNAVSDRDFLVLGSAAPGGQSATVPTKAPVFVPSFKGFDYRVRDFLETGAAAAPLPRLFQPDRPLLPPFSKAAKPAVSPAMKPQTLVAIASGELADRAIVKPLSLSDAEATGLAFRVAVGANGRITAVVPLASGAVPVASLGRFRAALDQLRFAPKADAEVQWGTVSFEWQEVKR